MTVNLQEAYDIRDLRRFNTADLIAEYYSRRKRQHNDRLFRGYFKIIEHKIERILGERKVKLPPYLD